MPDDSWIWELATGLGPVPEAELTLGAGALRPASGPAYLSPVTL